MTYGLTGYIKKFDKEVLSEQQLDIIKEKLHLAKKVN